MSKGGARATSGPPPDPMALRRDRPSDQSGWTSLPPTGRAGDPPAWPLPTSSDREAELWTQLWRKPQAVQWERLGLDHEVALYVRRAVEAEAPGSPVTLSTLVRQLGEALGLTPVGMLRLRWRLAPVVAVAPAAPAAPLAPAAAASSARPRRRKSVRQRLTVVEPPGGA